MTGDEHGVAAHGRLATIMGRLRGGEPLGNEHPGLLQDHVMAMVGEAGSPAGPQQPEAA